jgi:hypothetical protein
MRHRLVPGLISLAALGCHDTTAPAAGDRRVTVRTDHIVYRPLELVVVTTVNRTGAVVYDDHCGGEVEGYEFLKQWNASYGMARIGFDFDTTTDWRLHSIAIPVGAAHVDTMFVNDRAYTGTWRVTLYLRDESGTALAQDQRTSNTFHVNDTWIP